MNSIETPPPPSKHNYLQFALLVIAILWGVYLIELLTPIRFGNVQRGPMPWIVPIVGTPLIALCTWWNFFRARKFAADSIQVLATVVKIARAGVGVHTRVRLQYDFDERTYERSVPIYDSIVSKLQVGHQIPVLVLRRNPKKVQVPMNMQLL